MHGTCRRLEVNLLLLPKINSRWQCSIEHLTSQHCVLVLGCADQPANTIDHLALRVQLFLLGLLAKENHWAGRKHELSQNRFTLQTFSPNPGNLIYWYDKIKTHPDLRNISACLDAWGGKKTWYNCINLVLFFKWVLTHVYCANTIFLLVLI